ncbi:general secretion pathway protein GspH [Pseudomonas chlororaphis]|uniref:GspH/FimT family pseudopilin n=1 Tax=Pseudomonas chlororaphis TaxID=587753 RepID=UPI0004AC133F|nr:GspH/FimT family pseudopilin [Pseudomonas chlororaphis]AIC22435.1 general secretion pathway protein GspH [Pseudomonas chlororaphis]
MRYRTQGFTLIELLVALAVSAILLTLVVPAFSQMAQRSKADSDISELLRSLNYARLEAIDRGLPIHLRPAAVDSDWSRGLSIYQGDGPETNVLRVVPAVSRGARLTLTSEFDSIGFNALGGVSAAVPPVMTYVLGGQHRTITLCLNGRIAVNGECQ